MLYKMFQSTFITSIQVLLTEQLKTLPDNFSLQIFPSASKNRVLEEILWLSQCEKMKRKCLCCNFRSLALRSPSQPVALPSGKFPPMYSKLATQPKPSSRQNIARFQSLKISRPAKSIQLRNADGQFWDSKTANSSVGSRKKLKRLHEFVVFVGWSVKGRFESWRDCSSCHRAGWASCYCCHISVDSSSSSSSRKIRGLEEEEKTCLMLASFYCSSFEAAAARLVGGSCASNACCCLFWELKKGGGAAGLKIYFQFHLCAVRKMLLWIREKVV